MLSRILSGYVNRTDRKRKRDARIEDQEKPRKISYRKVPQESRRRQICLAPIKLRKWKPQKIPSICSEYSSDDDFHNWCTSRRTWKKTAVSLTYSPIERSVLPASSIAEQNEASVEAREANEENDTAASVDMSIARLECTPPHTPKIDRSTPSAPKKLLKSLRKEKVRKIYKEVVMLSCRQCRIFRQQQAQYEKRIKILEAALRPLKSDSYLPDYLDMVENMITSNE